MGIPRGLVLLFGLAAVLPSARLGAQQKAQRPPNILFAISDDQSWAHTSAEGYPAVRTPAFDRVAREGVRFTQAICASPGCSPSRAAILTGRNTWELEEAGTHASSFPAKLAVYPDILEGAGYQVGYTGKGWGPGDWKAGGRTRNPAGPELNRITVTPRPPAGISRVDYAANFEQFLRDRPAGKPFCFWYGGSEPHRAYVKGSGLAAGKKLEDAKVPDFLPDTPEIRSDVLDYCVEIEWFDRHLERMLQALEAAGELDNTLVVVTADNGMPFPRAKANVFEYGYRLPLAVRWPARVPGGRVVDDVVSLRDLMPTFLDAAGVRPPQPVSGRSLLSLLSSRKSGIVEESRDRAFVARERHSSARYKNWGYPVRAIRTRDYLYVRNFHPERWPAGDPQAEKADIERSNDPEGTGFFDIDGSPSKSVLLNRRSDPAIRPYFELATAKRPAEELYAVRTDPGCVKNLAADPAHAKIRGRLRKDLDDYLRKTGDPRMGPDPEIWERYPRYSPIRVFPEP